MPTPLDQHLQDLPCDLDRRRYNDNDHRVSLTSLTERRLTPSLVSTGHLAPPFLRAPYLERATLLSSGPRFRSITGCSARSVTTYTQTTDTGPRTPTAARRQHGVFFARMSPGNARLRLHTHRPGGRDFRRCRIVPRDAVARVRVARSPGVRSSGRARRGGRGLAASAHARAGFADGVLAGDPVGPGGGWAEAAAVSAQEGRAAALGGY